MALSNVVLGGILHEDIPSMIFWSGENRSRFFREVEGAAELVADI